MRTWRLSDARTHLGGSHDDLLEPQDAHNPKACTKRYCCISINKKNLQSQRQLPEAAAFTRSGDVSDRRVLYLRHPLKFVRSHVLCYLHQPRAEHYAPNEVGDSKKNLIVPTNALSEPNCGRNIGSNASQNEGRTPHVDCQVEEDVACVHKWVGQLDHEKASAKLAATAVVSVAAYEDQQGD